MGDTTANTEPTIDGRRARRERGRSAVIDAVFELAEEGKIPPTAELVAERSGVSVASIFRYFDGLDDLQLHAHRRFRERFAPLVAAVGDGSRSRRIEALVESRLDLYEQAGAIMALGRLRALEHEPLLQAATETKAALADQVRAALEPDTRDRSPGRVAELVAVIDALTSVEAWDVMRKTHARSRSQIAASWRLGIDALINSWEQDGN